MRTTVCILACASLLLLACGSKSGGGGNNNNTGDECGDGVIGASEGCDDGNDQAGDGCDDTCQVEAGWLCTGEPSVCGMCDDPDGDQYGTGPGCLGADCDESDADVNEGATEVCNGVDDNCDGQTDEQGDAVCYTGPAGTDGVGICQAGISYCIDGQPGPCVGQVVPISEACNNLDDDCDGQTDEDNAMLTCGVGACQNTVASCQAGQLQQCTPLASSGEQCGDNIDNDCDGVVDENCGCVYVSLQGDDANSGLQPDQSVRTIQMGIAIAQDPANPNQVCVAADPGCPRSVYRNDPTNGFNENFVMADGITVLGGYEYDPNNAWSRNCMHDTVIRPDVASGILFDASIVNVTTLDGFRIETENTTDPTVSAITIDGAAGASISNNQIFGADVGPTETKAVFIENGATPILFDNWIYGGHGSTRSIGVHSQNSSPQILKSCQNGDIQNGRCQGGCGPIQWGGKSIMGHTSTWPNPFPTRDFNYGVLLESSPGALIDQTAICAFGGVIEDAAVKVLGNATGTILTRGNYGAEGGATDAGIWLEDCGGAAPWIGDNEHIWSGGDRTGTAMVAGIRSWGDCHPLIEGNITIAGGFEGQTDNTAGIHCGMSQASGIASLCAVLNNIDILGSTFGFPVSSTGIRCSDGACSLIRGNAWITGRGGLDVRGIYFDRSTSVMVDKNVIVGGCATVIATAILADDAAGRVQNNVIWGGDCTGGGATSVEVSGVAINTTDGPNEMDVHSNYIHGGGEATACVSRGLALGLLSGGTPPTSPLGIFRNNIIDAGLCNTAYGVEELDSSADPRFFENNDVLWPGVATALYRDESTTDLQTATDINALTDCTCGGNIDQDPLIGGPPSQFQNLGTGSPCIDAGTTTGAPADDFEGEVRPSGSAPDIGPDEFM